MISLAGPATMSSVVGVSSLYQTSPTDGPPLKVAALSSAAVPSSFRCFLKSFSGSRALAVSAVATPNSVLTEEAFKGISGRSLTKAPLGDELEEEEDGGEFDEDGVEDEEDYGGDEAVGSGDGELAIANLGLPQQLVGSLRKRGSTQLSPIQVGDEEEKLAERIKLYAAPTTSTSKRTILSDPITEATQPQAVRRPRYLSSGIGTFVAAAIAMQPVPSEALAQFCDATITQAGLISGESNATCLHFQRLVLMNLDSTTAKLAISVIGPLLSAYGFLFISRIVMSWYPKLPVRKFPYVVAYAPTEPLLILTRKLIPPLGGVDVTPVVWFGLISFLNEILVGPQGLLVLLSQQV